MSPSDPIRCARPDNLPALMRGLAALARDLGDPFAIHEESLHAALFGDAAHSGALISGDAPRGVVLFSPFVSTTLGDTCLYVSDLWVSPSARGTALGRGLLSAAMREGAARWEAKALFLNVYAENAAALGFYRHLGFTFKDSDRRAALTGDALNRLMRQDTPA